MSQLINDKYSPDQVMMTLSAIAYTSFDSIATLQDKLNAAEALEQAYEAIWWVRDDPNLLYIVKNRLSEDYAIAIRGPVFRLGLSLLFDLYENLDIAHQVSFPYSKLGNAKIAAGILDAIQSINNLTYNGRTLHQVINNFPKGSKVYITGHSLGGALATVYAAKLVCSNLVDLDIIPYTFAAPSAGNKPFADLFNPNSGNCLFSQSSGCVSSLDIIPYAWHDLQGIPAVDYGNIKCPIEFTLCVDCLARLLILARVVYSQPPLKRQLTGQIDPYDSFFEEATHQHQHNTYLSLLHLDPINSAGYSFKQQTEKVLTESL